MSSERSVARNVQEGWNEGLYGNVGDGFGETSRGFAKNSNFNNSRGCSNPEGYILPTSPATRLPPDQNVEEGYVDATEIEEDIYATNPNKGPLTRITSLPSIANDDIIMTSSAPLSLPMIIHEQSIEDIYDTTDSVMQSDVQPDSLVDQDYYNYEDAVDEIYDDTTSLQEEIVRVNTQGTVPKNSPRPNVSQPPEIEEDIYDDTIVSEFRRDYPTSVQDSQNDEIYSDASSVFQQPPPPVLKRTRVNAPLPLPPQPHESVVQLPPQHRRSAVPLPSRETYKQTEVQSPPMPQRTKAHPPPQLPCRKTYKGTAPEHVEEEDNPTYSDAASVFQSLPAQKLSGSSRFPPFPVMESDEQSDVYTYLTELEVDEILSEEPEVNTSSRSSNSKTKVSPPSPSLSVRSPNPSLTTTPEASRRTSSSASLEASPPLPPPRKSSMNCDSDPNAPPLPSRTNFRTPPPSSSPGVQRRVSRQRSRATKTRSTSDPPSPLMSSGFGQLDLPSYFSNPSNHSHRPPSKLLERRKSNDEVFSPPLNVRLSKRFSEPTTHGYVPKQQISRPTVPVLPHRLREEDPSQEDYAEIDECVELDVYETPIAGQPQQYSAPLQRSKPSLNVTQKRNSPPSSPPSNNQKDITPPPLPPVILVGDRPKAPLPSEALMATKFKTSPEKTAPLQNNPPPSKPPRARKVSLGGPAPPAPPTRTAASSVGAPPPPPVRNTPLLETLPRPTATPPAPPVRKRSSNPPASIPPPAPPSRFIPSQALSQSPPGFPPPPPPPPPIGQTKPSPVTQLRSSQTQSSHPSPAAPTDNLLAGIQNLQLRKATEREELQVIPPPSNGGSSGPGNLMAEMKSFKLKKTKDTAPKVTSNVNDSPFHLKTTPSSQAPPVSPHLNSSHQMREKSNSPPTIPSRKANPRSSPPLNGHVTSHDSMSDVSSDNRLPEWKKTLLDKKRREQQQVNRDK